MLITNQAGTVSLTAQFAVEISGASAIWIATAHVSPLACESLNLRVRAGHIPVHYSHA